MLPDWPKKAMLRRLLKTSFFNVLKHFNVLKLFLPLAGIWKPSITKDLLLND